LNVHTEGMTLGLAASFSKKRSHPFSSLSGPDKLKHESGQKKEGKDQVEGREERRRIAFRRWSALAGNVVVRAKKWKDMGKDEKSGKRGGKRGRSSPLILYCHRDEEKGKRLLGLYLGKKKKGEVLLEKMKKGGKKKGKRRKGETPISLKKEDWLAETDAAAGVLSIVWGGRQRGEKGRKGGGGEEGPFCLSIYSHHTGRVRHTGALKKKNRL